MRIGQPHSGQQYERVVGRRRTVQPYTITCEAGDDPHDDDAAFALVSATAPVELNGLRRKSIRLTAEDYGLWKAAVEYVPGAGAGSYPGGSLEYDVVSYSAEVGTENTRITHSRDSVVYHNPHDTPPPNFNAICAGPDGIEGTEILVPTLQWSETYTIPSAEVQSGDFVRKVFAITGKVNNAPFRIFDVGEVLFLGAPFEWKFGEDAQATFRFAAQRNLTGLEYMLGSSASGRVEVDKKGWEFLDVRYDDDADDASKSLYKRPRTIFVHQVYDYGDFSSLGIGG